MKNLWQRAVRRFVLVPAGYGRPAESAVMDREYTSGAWSHFRADAEHQRYQAIVDLLAARPGNPSVLDLGCGSGRLAELLQPLPVSRYLGVDLSPAGLELARALQLPRGEFVEGDFEVWTPANAYDVIVFSECIGYADDPCRLVSRYAPWLAADGIMIVTLFRSESWEARWRRVDRRTETLSAQVVRNDRDQVWDVRVLRPRSA